MKTKLLIPVFLCIALCLLPGYLNAQEVYNPYDEEENNGEANQTSDLPGAYITIGGGIYYYAGLIGIGVEVPFNEQFTVFGRGGLGGWGLKYGLGFRFMPNGPYGAAFDLGFAQASGGTLDFEMEVEGSGDPQEISLELMPANTLNLGFNYYWQLGRYHKFGIGGGYAVALHNDRYEVTSGETLTDESETIMQILQPGGVMVNLEFLIGL